MLICLHSEKEIAEIPKKIASRQRLIVNSDGKVPREKRKPGREVQGRPGPDLSPRPARWAGPGVPPLLAQRFPHPIISIV